MTQKSIPPTFDGMSQVITGLVETSKIARQHLEDAETNLRKLVDKMKASEPSQEPRTLQMFADSLREYLDNLERVQSVSEQLTMCTEEMLIGAEKFTPRAKPN